MCVINKNTAIAGVLAFAAKTAAHGIVTGIVADGQYNLGYDPGFKYRNPPPTVAGWSIPTVEDRGFVSDLNGPDIVCHRGATNGQTYVKVAAGGTLEFQWTEWPEAHHGPMIDYLAPCGGDCTTVEKTSLKFIKVAEAGLNNGSPAPGSWASDDMRTNNNTWVVKVPSDVAPGKYVWRHETIALHSAHESHGAQPYPQCVNVEISGSGTNDMSGGQSAEEFYSWTDPGIELNIYYPPLTSYEIPGPPLMEGGGSGSGSAPAPSSGYSFPSGGYSNSTIHPTGGSGPKPTGRPGGNKPPGGSVSITATPTAATQVVETSTVPTPQVPAAEEGDDSIKPVVPNPGAGAPAPEVGEQKPSSTAPASFTSTWTGRIGKPTKFTCYAEE
ncbi:uncharacterized protein HMPREF1541_03990 [Cyphellophora europaea CBS 101466]|uniref:Auxiliary Activity family 9 catalytic domain-containing protein n=1 Tax=Cyphellophora europaea (strain CBS 101466) TaxID=1220924 RepID=W2RZZ2_CYPE1|nr:uncharacterized protein HMPREF1541_03990 [Cyphellophora europaea CBS 101466]ETN42051.1 hypothetical protein HMPREF1541_03990 [Cyphellophora europaea CBS 101466]